MARLESRAKAGFYPTPDTVCELLKSKISFEDGSRLLDPCCGEGKTLSQLADGAPNLTTYGIELDHQRAIEARSRLTRVLWGDSLTEVTISPKGFGLLYLNPPYDTGMANGEKAQRLEVQFLRRYLGTLQHGGYLILVIPYYILKYCAKFLARHFAEPMVIRFPQDEFQAFKQCVVFGKKRMARKDQADMAQKYLEALSECTPDEFLKKVNGFDYISPGDLSVPAPIKKLHFKTQNIDPSEIFPLAHKSEILQNIFQDLTPRQNNIIRPINPVKKGQQAFILAGGYMNGAIIKNDRQLVIKGVVASSEDIVDVKSGRNDSGTIKTRSNHRPVIKVIDIQAAKIFTVQ